MPDLWHRCTWGALQSHHQEKLRKVGQALKQGLEPCLSSPERREEAGLWLLPLPSQDPILRAVTEVSAIKTARYKHTME